MADKQSLRIKKLINRSSEFFVGIPAGLISHECTAGALAKVIVYSLSLDGAVRPGNGSTPGTPSSEGFVAGSRALDSLDKLVTSVESFFHPSNYGIWSLNVRILLWGEECGGLIPFSAHPFRPTSHGGVLQEMEG